MAVDTPVLDHLMIRVADLERSRAFYERALAPLGITVVRERGGWVGFGRAPRASFWIAAASDPHQPMHVCFGADNRDQVRAFHAAALAAGASDNGAPGVREIYHPDYYGGFVLDPDGHNVEAVCRRPGP